MLHFGSRCRHFFTLLGLVCLWITGVGCAPRSPTVPLPDTTPPVALFPTLTATPFADIVVPTVAPNGFPTVTPSPTFPSTPRVVTTATPFIPPDIEIPPALVMVPCEQFEILTRASATQGYTLCGYVTVPERHETPDNGRTLRLAVVIYKSPSRTAQPDPLLLAQGGPGGSTLYLYGNHISFLVPEVLQTRDIVLIEQRGTRFSHPFLYCDEVEYFLMGTLDDPAGYEDVFEKQDALQRCYNRLRAQGVNLNAYNSIENAHDMAYVTEALGYEAFNFYGVSYGALLGQHLLNLYPDRLRSMVLDSVVPMQTNWIVEAPRSADLALKGIFAACAADSRCDSRYPALEATFLTTVNRLNREPSSVLIQRPTYSATIRLTGDLFIRVLYDMMYLEAGRVPAVIAGVAEGNIGMIQSQIVDHAVTALAGTNGMYASTMCAEDGDYAADTLVDIEGLYPDVARVVGGTLDNDLLELCPVWQVTPLSADVDTLVQSEVPTLLLTGDLDPITPPAFAEEVAEGLPNSTVLTFPRQSHGVFFRTDCARQLTSQFVIDPAARLDVACIAQAGQSFR
jgi:pimeloyl-ACP methyl ester carboxylesterase